VPFERGKVLGITANAGCAPGFSVPELLVVMGIIMVIASMAIFSYNNVLPTIRADAAMQYFEAQLRQAREVSVDQRRNIQVTFKGTGELVTVRQNLNITTTPPTVISTTTLSDYILDPNQMVYAVLTGVPDTPDRFNTPSVCVTSSGICFNSSACGTPAALPCTITFQSDGTVVNSSGAYINGTIFMGNAGNSLTARAITILGATGRIKGYRYNGKAWF
jgi:Tfp pilus assembly protein FimT